MEFKPPHLFYLSNVCAEQFIPFLHSNLLQFSKNAITFPLCLLSRLNAIYFSSPPWNSFLELSEFLFSFLPPSPLQLAALFYMRYTTLNCMPAEMS